MLPSGSQPMSVGRSKVYLPGLAAGPERGAEASASTGSGLLPRVIITRPAGLNSMTMLEPSSTAQILFQRIDSHRVSKHEAVETFTDLADIFSLRIEFEQTRTLASRINEDVSFGVRGDADAFAEVQVRGKL